MDRAEHAVAVGVQLPAVGLDKPLVGALVARAGAFEECLLYQCTPFMRFAMAICSMEAFSSLPPSLSPLAAAESGKTL